MKKKIMVLAVLLFILTLVLFACGESNMDGTPGGNTPGGGDNTGSGKPGEIIDNSIFTPDMTESEILAIVNSIKYVAIDVSGYDEYNNKATYYVGETGIYCLGTYGRNNKTFISIIFYDGTVFYEYDDEMEEVYYDATDYAGYDTDFQGDLGGIVKNLVEGIIEGMQSGYSIENGCLKAGEFTVRYWDGKSEIELPDVFADYKSLPTNSPVKFTLSEDGTYYILSYASSRLTKYTVPEIYEGLPVKEISARSFGNFDEFTIPACIEKLPECVDVDTPLSIIYKGTMAQWYKLSKDIRWSIEENVTVTCSDGVYDNATAQ